MKNKCHLSNPAWNPVLPRVLSDWLVLKVTWLLIGPTVPGPPSLSPRIRNPEWSRLRGWMPLQKYLQKYLQKWITVSWMPLQRFFTKVLLRDNRFGWLTVLWRNTGVYQSKIWDTVVTAGTVGTVDKRWSGKFYAVSQPSCGKSQSTLPMLSLGKGSQKWSFYYLTLF